jgi:phosphoglycolate phosphatase-like HAD superfamily hydrolase
VLFPALRRCFNPSDDDAIDMKIDPAWRAVLVCLTLITSSCSTAPTRSTPLAASAAFAAEADPLPSWNDGSAKKAILDFVKTTTDKNSSKFVPPQERIATFDQDGTTWVEHPIYSQVLFTFDRVAALAPQHPEWKTTQPFQAVLSGDKEAMAKFSLKDIEALVFATHTGMTTEAFQSIVKAWMANARHPRFHAPYSQMVYEPMLEVMSYLRDNGYKTYIVTGGGQAFVRAYAQQVYGIPPEQVIGSAPTTRYEYQDGQGILMRQPRLLLNNDLAGKPEDIYLFLGVIRGWRSGIPVVTVRCSSTRKTPAEPRWSCWSSTTTLCASMPTAQRRACPTARWGPFRKHYTTRQKPRVGPSSA